MIILTSEMFRRVALTKRQTLHTEKLQLFTKNFNWSLYHPPSPLLSLFISLSPSLYLPLSLPLSLSPSLSLSLSAASLSLKSFFAMPSLQQLPGYR